MPMVPDLFVPSFPLSECQRLFHGRGHAFPTLEHINVDWLSPVLLLTLYAEVSNEWLGEFVEKACKALPVCESIQVQYRYLNKSPCAVLWGDHIFQLDVVESDLKYKIELGDKQNSGLFLDMRIGRDWVKENSKYKRVLNLFAYTCAFSVAAIAGDAEQVINIDNNKGVLQRGRDNHRLNLQDTKKVRFEGVNIFKSYSRIKKYAPYDLLICDPPSFQVGSVDIKRDYRKIVSRLPLWMNDAGLVMLCLNCPRLDLTFLHNLIIEECPQCEFIESLQPPSVFKEAMDGKGLKILIFKYHSA